MSDGKLEVVGVTDVLHLAFSLGGLANAVRLCQGSALEIGCAGGGVPLQIDGEPFNVAPPDGAASAASAGLEPFQVSVAQQGQALLLARGAAGATVGPSGYAAVERALAEGQIGTSQRDALLRALSPI